jgi:glycerol-3-phosphate O-acyltransferase
MRKEDKERVLVEVTSRLVQEKVLAARRPGGMPVENLLNDTLYHERKRLEREPDSAARRADLEFWREVSQTLGRASEEQLRELLQRVIRRFVLEIMGNFNETFYKVTTRAIPVGIMGLFNALSPARLLRGRRGFPKVEDSVVIGGATDALRSVADKGTVVLVPTHSSHLDSILVGWALWHLGLPPFLYGAGLNLFTNPVMGVFMSNLGAYRVDRKKQNALYKDVLKGYATYSIELGYHNLFFPGGTRSRSGKVEQHLKLGLLGTGLEAYINNLIAGRPKPNVYVVPCTVNFPLVLEAETLIDDYLKEAGKARYIITDDEFSRPRRILEFAREAMTLDARIHMHICPPLDVFGNRVDDGGQSLDGRGRVIDTSRYVMVGGRPAPDAQRDQQYTRELGDAVAREFLAGTTALSTHLLAFAVYRMFQAKNDGLDLYRLLRTQAGIESVPLADVYVLLQRVVDRLRGMHAEGAIQLGPMLRDGSVSDIASDALRLFGTYHVHAAIARRGDRLFSEDMNLLYYYHNRLIGFGLETEVDDLAKRRAA